MPFPRLMALAFSLLLAQLVFAQKAPLLSEIPDTEEGFVKSEPHVLATIHWLENTPITSQENKRGEQYALFLQWITETPTVTLELNSDVLTYSKKNVELLMFFMAGWTKYALTHDYSKDKVKGSLAGLEAIISIYQKGGWKRDKKVEKLIKMKEAGELEAWVKQKLNP